MRRQWDSRSRRNDEQRGSALLNMSLVIAVLLLGMLVLGGVAQRVMWRAQAQAAADAAALAGVAGGYDEALDLARRNGARVTRFDAEGNVVEVEIDYRGTTAIARAERSLDYDRKGCPSLACSGP